MSPVAEAKITPRFKTRYRDEILPALTERFGYATPMQAPRLLKITLNMGVGDAKQDTNMLEAALEQLTVIAGQRPNVRRARKSIANFKLREEMPVGVAVRGLNPRSFDGRGNYSMGVREQIIFPEIDYDSIDQVRGLDVTISTSAQTDEEAFALLEAFGMPFRREGRPGGPDADAAAAAEEEQRKEEARARAEAEQAALEELKAENPEAYEKPQAPEGEETEGGEGDGGGGDAAPADES
jgi:large subunit ribosomal protein L5